MNRFARIVVSLAAGLLVGLSGCSGSLFQSKAAPPTIYVLSGGPAGAATSGPASPSIPVDLAVLKPRVRVGLDSDRIAVLYPDRRLDYFADARWSGPLGDVLQDLAVQEFHRRANVRTVSGDSSVFASAYWLEIEVTDFQAEYASVGVAPTIRVHVLARVGRSSDRQILGRFEATAQQAAAENRLTAIVDAYAHAADAALDKIVADATGALRTASENH